MFTIKPTIKTNLASRNFHETRSFSRNQRKFTPRENNPLIYGITYDFKVRSPWECTCQHQTSVLHLLNYSIGVLDCSNRVLDCSIKEYLSF